MGTNIWKELLFLGGYAGVALAHEEMARAAPLPAEPKEVVAVFLREVRSGRHPEWADRYLAPHVVAHQLVAEAPADVDRTPARQPEPPAADLPAATEPARVVGI